MSTNLTTTFAPLTTIISWFGENAVPTDKQFETTWKSFFHKSENIPLEQIYQLSEILNLKAERVHSHLDMAKRDGSNLTNSDITGLKEVLGVALAANGIIGNVETAISTEVANLLTDGIYKPKTTGVYNAIGLTAKENYSTLFRKNAGVWSVFSEEQLLVPDYSGSIAAGQTTKAVNGDTIIKAYPREYTSKNLFDDELVVVDKYIDASGNKVTANGWWYSQNIPLIVGSTYAKAGGSFAIYKADNTIIVRHAASVVNFVVPAEASYGILTGVTVDLSIAMVVLGTTTGVYVSGRKSLSRAAIPKPLSTSKAVEGNIEPISGDNVYQATLLLVQGSYSKNVNLFDKETVTLGSYIDASGNPAVATDWFYSKKINVTPNTLYTNSGTNVVEYNASGGLIVRNAASANEITINANTSYVIITGLKSALDTAMFRVGNTPRPYESGIKKILKTQIADFYIESNLIVVSKQGFFNTILKAVQYIQYIGNPTKNPLNRWTILVYPGDYEEVVNIADRYISLVGIDKYSCRIIDKSGKYINSTVNMGGGNLLANFTIIASEENKPADYTGEPAYCVHHDYSGEGESFIENCELISSSSAPLGIGLQHNQQLTIKNVVAKCKTFNRPALLMHNNLLAGSTKQKMIVENSRFYADGDTALYLVDSNQTSGAKDSVDTTLSFYNTMFFSKTRGKVNIIGGTSPMTVGANSGDYGLMKVTLDSFGNNLTELNR